MAKMPPFEFLDHTADIKLQIHGKALPEIFKHTALAVSYYLTGGKKVRPRLITQISVAGQDQEEMLYAFVDELIYLLDAEKFLVAKADVIIEGKTLYAIVYGDAAERYEIKHIKAATYAEMSIRQDLRGWNATIVLDV